MQSWEIAGEKMQVEKLNKIKAKIDDGRSLNGFEKMFYTVETGDRDYRDEDWGEERVIKYRE